MLGECPGRFKKHVTFLGAVSRGFARRPIDKETDRLRACRQRLLSLACLRLPVVVFQQYARAFGISVAAYVWYARLPPLYASTIRGVYCSVRQYLAASHC